MASRQDATLDRVVSRHTPTCIFLRWILATKAGRPRSASSTKDLPIHVGYSLQLRHQQHAHAHIHESTCIPAIANRLGLLPSSATGLSVSLRRNGNDASSQRRTTSHATPTESEAVRIASSRFYCGLHYHSASLRRAGHEPERSNARWVTPGHMRTSALPSCRWATSCMFGAVVTSR